MAAPSRMLAWEIPQIAEPGGRRSMESQRIGHDSVTGHACTPDTQHNTEATESIRETLAE